MQVEEKRNAVTGKWPKPLGEEYFGRLLRGVPVQLENFRGLDAGPGIPVPPRGTA